MLCLFDSENLYDIICYSNKFWNMNSINCVRMFKQIFFFKNHMDPAFFGLLDHNTRKEKLNEKYRVITIIPSLIKESNSS